MWDMYQVILVGLQRSSLLFMPVIAETATLIPQQQATDTGAPSGQHSGLKLCKDGTPPLQRPQSTQWEYIPSVLGHPAPLSLLVSAHTVQKVRVVLAKNSQNHPL